MKPEDFTPEFPEEFSPVPTEDAPTMQLPDLQEEFLFAQPTPSLDATQVIPPAQEAPQPTPFLSDITQEIPPYTYIPQQPPRKTKRKGKRIVLAVLLTLAALVIIGGLCFSIFDSLMERLAPKPTPTRFPLNEGPGYTPGDGSIIIDNQWVIGYLHTENGAMEVYIGADGTIYDLEGNIIYIETVSPDGQGGFIIGGTPSEETTPAPAEDGWAYYVHADGGLNLRESPSTSGKQITIIPEGSPLFPSRWENGWAYVDYNGVSGWCSGQYLKQEMNLAISYYVHADGGLNLRTEPTSSSNRVGNIPNGTRVTPIGWRYGWAYIRYEGQTGWCSGQYLKLEPVKTNPPSGNDPGPSGNQGSQSSTGKRYTWAQVQDALADTRATVNSYRGKNTGKGYTTMTAEKAKQFYEDMIRSAYYPASDVTPGPQLNIMDAPDWYDDMTIRYNPSSHSLRSLCEYAFSYLSDDAAYAKVYRHWSGRDDGFLEIDGVPYYLMVGIGDAGIRTEYTLDVVEEGGAFVLTMYVKSYWDENGPPEEWTATCRCFLEDGVWVWDKIITPYQ